MKIFSLFLICSLFYKSQALNVLAYWPFNGDLNDIGPNAQHCSVNSGGTVSVTDGKVASTSAYKFNKNGYLTCGFDNIPAASMKTISGYFYFGTHSEDYAEIWSKSSTSEGGEMSLLDDNLCTYWMNPDEANYSRCFTASQNTWYHIAVTQNLVSVNLYVNGVLVSSGSPGLSTISDASNLFMGTWNTNPGARQFNGTIDHLMIFDTLLSASDIYKLYTATSSKKLSYAELLATLNSPSMQPSKRPSRKPTTAPSIKPTKAPSLQPSKRPSKSPTNQPIEVITVTPSSKPSSFFSASSTSKPTSFPTFILASQPTNKPTSTPSVSPTPLPTWSPTINPSPQPFHKSCFQSSSSCCCSSSQQPISIVVNINF